jgi:hypothetical protein
MGAVRRFAWEVAKRLFWLCFVVITIAGWVLLLVARAVLRAAVR